MFVDTTDLEPFADIDAAKAVAMIADAEANAISVAPCIVNAAGDAPSDDLTANQLAVIKSILRAVVLRWNDAGNGATVQQTAGPYSMTVDTGSSNKFGRLWPSEIEQLQGICAGTVTGRAFSLSHIAEGAAHLPWCAYSLGATYCSCGVDIAGQPIYENL